MLDLKTPASGEAERNDYDNIAHLTARDQVKFVICDRADYLWVRSKIAEFALPDRVADVLFSPSHGQLAARELAEWILAERVSRALGASDIFIGVNAVDYSGYPDCRPAFIDAFTQLARVATRAGVEGGSALFTRR